MHGETASINTPTTYTVWTGLRDARRDKRLTWAQLAAQVNRSYRHIKEVEQGRVGASEELLFALADTLDRRPSELAQTRPKVPPQDRSHDRRQRSAKTREQVAS